MSVNGSRDTKSFVVSQSISVAVSSVPWMAILRFIVEYCGAQFMGRHEARTTLARELGATDVVAERGDEAVQRIRQLTGGAGVHGVLECVGTEQSTLTSVEIARPGGTVGRVGVPHYPAIPQAQPMFYMNVKVGGGPAPVRAYIEELLPDILDGTIQPGKVFDRTVGLDGVPDGYRAMADRESIKVIVKP